MNAQIATGLTGRGTKLHFAHNGVATCNQGRLNNGYALHSIKSAAEVQAETPWSIYLEVFAAGLEKSNLAPCLSCAASIGYEVTA